MHLSSFSNKGQERATVKERQAGRRREQAAAPQILSSDLRFPKTSSELYSDNSLNGYVNWVLHTVTIKKLVSFFIDLKS